MMDKKKKLAILRELKEARLRRDVLIPLFQSMVFKEVIEYHGPLEKGKDIIYYTLDPFGNKKYTHVVVKKENISGTVSKSSGAKEVLFQIEQGFDESYTDIYGLKEVKMDRCLVVTAGDIKPAAIESISGKLAKSNLDKLVDFIDGPKLIELMDEFMPGYLFEEYEKFNTYFNAMKADFEKIRDVSAIGQGKAVPLEEIYVSLKLSQTVSTPEPEIAGEFDKGDVDPASKGRMLMGRMHKREQVMDADQAVERFRRLVITGAPGAGKTTLLKHLALKACKENLDKKDRLRVPVWITLRDLLQCKAKCLRHYIDKVFEKYDFPDAKKSVEKDLETGKCILLLDGFDELATLDNQETVASHIHEFARQYPQCRIAVTSRTAGYHGQLKGFDRLEVMEFDDKQVETFIQNWFSQSDKTKAPAMTRAVKGNESIFKLARNPLMIAIIAVIYEEDQELPQRRVELYKRAVDVLLSRWDKQKQIKNIYKADQKEFFLKKLALDNHTHRRRVMKEEEVLSVLQRHAAQIGLEKNKEKEFIREIWMRSYLLREVAHGQYDFLHLSFQEYFTALELKDNIDGMERVIKHVFDPWWEEPSLLYAGLIQDAAHLVKRIEKEVSEDRFYNRLMLTGNCIADARFTDEEVKDGVVDQLWELFQNGEYPLLRSHSMEVLSRIKPLCVIQHLVDELSDEDGDVRWSAAEALGKIGTVETLPVLIKAMNSHEDVAVRLVATDALGATGAVEALPHLIKTMNSHEDSNARRNAALALGKIGAVETLPVLIKAMNSHEDVAVRWIAAKALGMIGGIEALPPLIHSMNTDENSIVRVSAADALGKIGADESLPHLIKAMKTDEDVNVRSYAVLALDRIGAGEALPHLIQTMNTDEKSIVRVHAAEVLGKIGEGDALPYLITAMKTNEDVNVRQRAAYGLGNIGSVDALPHLIQAMNTDKDSRVRLSAAVALGDIGVFEALPHLINTMKTDKSTNVRRFTASALGNIGSVVALPHLIETMKTDVDIMVRRYAASALGNIGGETAVLALEEALNDERESFGLKIKDDAFVSLYRIDKRLKSRREEERK